MASNDTAAYMQTLARVSSSPVSVVAEMKSHPKVQVLMLSNVSESAIESQDNIRLHFMVVKVLRNGFATANYDPDEKKKKGGKAVRKDPNNEIYKVTPGGLLLTRTYERVGMAGKGDASEDAACIVPGMVMQCSVFRDKEKGWGDMFGGGDPESASYRPLQGLPAFSQAVLMFASRSSAAKSTVGGGLLQVKEAVPVKLPFVFGDSFGGLQRGGAGLFVGSTEESCDRRVAMMDSARLSDECSFKVNQEYIQGMLAQTRHVLQFWPSLADCDIGRNPDGTLYVQVGQGHAKFGVEVARVRLHDPYGYLATMGDGDWIENMLRFALSMDALHVVFTYDSMREEMGGEDAIVDGCCSISLGKMFAVCDETKLVDTSSLTEEESTLFLRGGDASDFDVFKCDAGVGGNGAYACVASKRVSKQDMDGYVQEVGVPVWQPLICNPKATVPWKEGRLVRVFQNGAMVFFFIASYTAACGAGTKRGFNELSQDGLDGLL